MNKNIKIIIILITLILISIIVFILLNKKNKSVNIDTVATEQENTVENRNTFNTNKTTQTNKDIVVQQNIVEGDKGEEDYIYKNIQKNIFNWNITKDPELLKKSITLSENASNETILESWRSFMTSNSSELIKLVNTSSNSIEDKETVRLIFEWYINLSGEYEKLSASKKAEISNQYKLLK